MPKSDERFARQYRYEPPPKFPLASPCSGIVRYLSGPIMCAGVRVGPVTNPTGGIGAAFDDTFPPLAFATRLGFLHPNARIHVRLLGPCFKTGRMAPFHQIRGFREGPPPTPRPPSKRPCRSRGRPERGERVRGRASPCVGRNPTRATKRPRSTPTLYGRTEREARASYTLTDAYSVPPRRF